MAESKPIPEPKRFFVSYTRRGDDDGTLADLLVDRLRTEGHEVFIDVDIPIGVDWAKRIAEKLDWCHYFVVLLSEHSINSEMVQGEIRWAHQRRKADGTPRILPVRVRYDGPLDYELASYLSRTQYAKWTGPEDSPGLLDRILAVAQGLEDAGLPAERTVGGERRAGVRDEGRTAAPANPRAARPPSGAMEDDDPFYIERGADRSLMPLAALPGETVVIKGARQIGKSSLLLRYLAACEAAGKRIVWLDFQSFTDADLADYPKFLGDLAASIADELEIETDRASTVDSHAAFTDFMEDEIVAKLDAPLTLAFDEADRILGRPYQHDFFALLRMWHNKRARRRSPWKAVDIAIVIATEPYLLIETADQSPFNVGLVLTLEPFGDSDVDRLNALYGAPLNDVELVDLTDLAGGHPYLTRWTFYRLVAPPGLPFAELQEHAVDRDGPFAEHLKALLLKLQRQEKLLPAMKQAIANGSVPDEESFYRLKGSGLVRPEDGRVVPSNLLYARFFKSI